MCEVMLINWETLCRALLINMTEISTKIKILISVFTKQSGAQYLGSWWMLINDN